jgi:hypothetical protein
MVADEVPSKQNRQQRYQEYPFLEHQPEKAEHQVKKQQVGVGEPEEGGYPEFIGTDMHRKVGKQEKGGQYNITV